MKIKGEEGKSLPISKRNSRKEEYQGHRLLLTS
jgi:hypothetical protein